MRAIAYAETPGLSSARTVPSNDGRCVLFGFGSGALARLASPVAVDRRPGPEVSVRKVRAGSSASAQHQSAAIFQAGGAGHCISESTSDVRAISPFLSFSSSFLCRVSWLRTNTTIVGRCVRRGWFRDSRERDEVTEICTRPHGKDHDATPRAAAYLDTQYCTEYCTVRYLGASDDKDATRTSQAAARGDHRDGCANSTNTTRQPDAGHDGQT